MPSFLGKPFLSQAQTKKANLLLATMFIGAAAVITPALNHQASFTEPIIAPTQQTQSIAEHAHHHAHDGHEHKNISGFVVKTNDSQDPASYKVNSDKLPSVEKVHAIAQQMLEDLKPAVGVPMKVQINTQASNSVMALASSQDECTLLINPSQMSWDTWRDLGLHRTSDQNVHEGVIKTVIAHEIGHCAQAHPAHLEQPGALTKLLALGNLTEPTYFMQHVKRPILEKEEYADLFAMSYAVKHLPEAQAVPGVASLYGMRMVNGSSDKAHDTVKQLEQRFERIGELGKIDVPLSQLGKVVDQIHKKPTESLLAKAPQSTPDAQQALANLPSLSGATQRLGQQNAKSQQIQNQQAQGPSLIAPKTPTM